MIELYCSKCGKVLCNHVGTCYVKKHKEIVCPNCGCKNYIEPNKRYRQIPKSQISVVKG